MKTYTLSFADSTGHLPDNPERTAIRQQANDFDVVYRVWPCRQSLLSFFNAQDKNPYRSTNWQEWKKVKIKGIE